MEFLDPQLGVHSWFKDGSVSTPTLPKIVDFLESHLHSGSGYKAVLDMGCGNGKLLELLVNKGWPLRQVVGCDIEPGHVTLARQRTGMSSRIIQWDAASLGADDLPVQRYGAIVAINWLHNDWRHKHAINIVSHTETDYNLVDKVLSNVLYLLDPEGYFICDYSDRFPTWLTRSVSGFLKTVHRAGFVIVDEVVDTRFDQSRVATWFFRRGSNGS